MAQKIEKTEEQWRRELDPDRYHVLREAGTEPPFTGAYTHSKQDGIYRCGACGNELFSSGTKFDSGTGWPSLYYPAVAGGVGAREDNRPVHERPRGVFPALRLAPRPCV